LITDPQLNSPIPKNSLLHQEPTNIVEEEDWFLPAERSDREPVLADILLGYAPLNHIYSIQATYSISKATSTALGAAVLPGIAAVREVGLLPRRHTITNM